MREHKSLFTGLRRVSALTVAAVLAMTLFSLRTEAGYEPERLLDEEIRIENESCLVWCRTILSECPADDGQLSVEELAGPGLSSWMVKIGEREVSRGPVKGSESAPGDKKLRLSSENRVLIVLTGKSGSGIRVRLIGPATMPPSRSVLSANLIGGPTIHSVGSISLGFNPDRPAAGEPAPEIELKCNPDNIVPGEFVKLSWNVRNGAYQSLSPLGVEVPPSGSALIWPEGDTQYSIGVMGRGGRASKSVSVKVVFPEPEVNLNVEPENPVIGQEIVVSWTTRNARKVMLRKRMSVGEETVPLCGERRFKASRQNIFELRAINGDKNVTETKSVYGVEPPASNALQESVKKLNPIPLGIDKKLRSLWKDLKNALKEGDAAKASSCFIMEKREQYLEMFSSLKENLSEFGREMGEIGSYDFNGGKALYKTKRKETIQGKEHEITYEILFAIDLDGQWRIVRL